MTTDYIAWLPPGALTDGALLREFECGAHAWGRAWFSATKVVVRTRPADEPFRQKHPSLWESRCRELQLATDSASHAQIVKQMIGFKKPWSALGPADTRFLRKLASASIADFLTRTAQLFQIQSTTGPAPAETKADRRERPAAMRFEVGIGGAPVLDLRIGQEAAVCARKALVPKPARRIALESKAKAIEKQTVAIAARAGVGLVDLSELHSLAAGDVLVLDRELRLGLELTLNGRPLKNGLSLHRDGATLRLSTTEKSGVGA